MTRSRLHNALFRDLQRVRPALLVSDI